MNRPQLEEAAPRGNETDIAVVNDGDTRSTSHGAGSDARDLNSTAEQQLLAFGFKWGTLLAAVCLLGVALYLGFFQSQTNEAIKDTFGIEQLKEGQESVRQIALLARLNIAHLQLLSCGIVVGLTFGFLGFALFLLGIKAESSAAGEGAGYKVKLEKLTPGLFVIICATVIVMTCVIRSSILTLSINETPQPPTESRTQALLPETKKRVGR